MDQFFKEDSYIVGICNNSGIRYKFDIEDYDIIAAHHWYTHKSGVYTYIKTLPKPTVGIPRWLLINHPELCPYHEYREIKHYNGDSFDYRKCNLYYGNTYRFFDSYVEGTCYDGRTFLIDVDDFEKIAPYSWCIEGNGYVHGNACKTKGVKQHRFVMGVYGGVSKIEVDHINHNTTDNRKSNLRLADRFTNCVNTRISKNNTSGVKGVYWCKPANKWAAQINHNGVRRYLGTFSCFEDACVARTAAEIDLHKEFRCTE